MSPRAPDPASRPPLSHGARGCPRQLKQGLSSGGGLDRRRLRAVAAAGVEAFPGSRSLRSLAGTPSALRASLASGPARKGLNPGFYPSPPPLRGIGGDKPPPRTLPGTASQLRPLAAHDLELDRRDATPPPD